MTACVIIDSNVIDPICYEAYKMLATPTVHLYGGRYIARGGKTRTLEGHWRPNPLLILEFDTMEMAKAGLHSGEYSAAKSIRSQTAISNMVAIEGV